MKNLIFNSSTLLSNQSIMEISSLGLSSLPSIPNTLNPISKTTFLLPSFSSNRFLTSQIHFSILKTTPFDKPTNTHSSSHFKTSKAASFPQKTSTPSLNSHKNTFLEENGLKLRLTVASMAAFYAQFPSLAVETNLAAAEQISNKIDLESVLVSIDDFFNRNPFFVYGVTFIWLVVIPLTQAYLKKYKFISAIDAFKKLQKDPNAELLDIRSNKKLLYLDSPNLKILNKKTVQIQFMEGEEEGFVKKVLEGFKDPGNTTICILDDFDGNSMKVAELLFKNGFKEAYAIKGGLRGKKGWQAIQETLLPPSVHVLPKKGGKSKQPEMEEGTNVLNDKNGQIPIVPNRIEEVENGYVNAKGSSSQGTPTSRYLSPYPNYPDMKPPSSPTPSKPRS